MLDVDDMAGAEYVEDPQAVMNDYVNDWAETQQKIAMCKRRIRLAKRLDDDDTVKRLEAEEAMHWNRLGKLDQCLQEEIEPVRAAFKQGTKILTDLWRKRRDYKAPEGGKTEPAQTEKPPTAEGKGSHG